MHATAAHVEGDPAGWCAGWCPVRLATEALAWRPLTRERRGWRSWRSDGRGGWVASDALPRGFDPWEHRHGPVDVEGPEYSREVFEVPAKGDDVEAAAELPPVEGEDAPQGDGAELGAERVEAAEHHDPAPAELAPLDGPDPSRGAPGDGEQLGAVEATPNPAPSAPLAAYVPPRSIPSPSWPSRPQGRPRPVMRAELPDDARAVREALRDPEQLARALELCEGRCGWGKGATWCRVAGGVLVQCPAHGDRSPSCSITRGPDGTVRVRCFGCDLAGDVFHLVAAVHGLDVRHNFADVLGAAARIAGVYIEAPGARRAAPSSPPRRAPPPPPPEEPDGLDVDTFAELARVLFDACPLDGPDAGDVRAYLDARRILEDARRDAWGALPSTERGRGDVRARIIAAVGLDAWTRSGLAHPRDLDRWCWGSTHRLVIPWRDVDGRVTWLQRRAVADVKGPRYVAPRGLEPSAPFGAEQLGALPLDAPVAVVEGAVDALSLRAAVALDGGSVAVLAAPGVQGWRKPWCALLHGRPVALAPDNDAAGDRFAAELGAELARVALKVERWRPAGGAKDWSEAWNTER